MTSTSASYTIAVLPGDGIGPEIVEQAKRILAEVSAICSLNFDFVTVSGGDLFKESAGVAVPEETFRVFEKSHALLKGPVGECVLEFVREFRFRYDLYVNLRPAKSYATICPPALRPDIDLLVIRENTEGFYKAIESEIVNDVWITSGVFTRRCWERIARLSFEYARRRLRNGNGKGRMTLAHKANIFPGSHGMMKDVCEQTSRNYPDIRFDHYYADAMCARLIREPHEFDVVLSENLLADLLSDLAGQVAGGLGMTPGTNMNFEKRMGYFEPTHGSAPDIAGTGKANPIGQMRAAALMLEFLGIAYNDDRCLKAYRLIERGIDHYLINNDKFSLPAELGGRATTSQVGSSIAAAIRGFA